MRQIKFRICHEAGGHKSVIYPIGQAQCNFLIDMLGIIYENYGTKEKPMWKNIFDADVFLQQYTGYQDKDGVDIYEGDILECSDKERTEVRWSKAYSGWQWCEHKLDDNEPTDFYGGLFSLEYKKVIGNVFTGIKE